VFLVVVLAVVACGCAGSSALEVPVTTATTRAPTTTTVPTAATTTSPLPLRTYQLGETASFSVSYGPAGDALEGHVDITIHRIYDPSNLVGNPVDYRREEIRQPPPAGKRNVALDVTIENTGGVGLGEGGVPPELTLMWGLNPTSPTYDGSYVGVGLPGANCHGRAQPPDVPGIFEGQSITGCILFTDIPDRVPIRAVTGWIEFAGNGQLPTMWVVK
jgi:hypothetical protein